MLGFLGGLGLITSFTTRRFVMVAPQSEPDPVSPRKRRANRRNARQSTGPRTSGGKRRSSRNAVTHGIFAADVVVLDGESRAQFIVAQQAYIRRLNPQDLVEMD